MVELQLRVSGLTGQLCELALVAPCSVQDAWMLELLTRPVHLQEHASLFSRSYQDVQQKSSGLCRCPEPWQEVKDALDAKLGIPAHEQRLLIGNEARQQHATAETFGSLEIGNLLQKFRLGVGALQTDGKQPRDLLISSHMSAGRSAISTLGSVMASSSVRVLCCGSFDTHPAAWLFHRRSPMRCACCMPVTAAWTFHCCGVRSCLPRAGCTGPRH